MKLKIIYLVMFVLLSSFASAFSITDILLQAWLLDNNNTDYMNVSNLTDSGSPPYVDGANFQGTYVENPDYKTTTSAGLQNVQCISHWVKFANLALPVEYWYLDIGEPSTNYFSSFYTASSVLKFRVKGGTGDDFTINCNVTPEIDKFYHVVGSIGASGAKLWINNSLCGEDVSTITLNSNFDTLEVGRGAGFYNSNNTVDEVLVFDEECNASFVDRLFTTFLRNATPPSDTLDIHFINETGADKLLFDEGEDFNIYLDYQYGNNTPVNNSQCNVTLTDGIIENDFVADNFTLCSSGCNGTTYNESLTISGNLLGGQEDSDFIHFKACNEQLSLGNLIVQMSCIAGNFTEIIPASSMPSCDEAAVTFFIYNDSCIFNNTVNLTFSSDVPNNRRKLVYDVSLDRQYDALKQRANSFNGSMYFNTTNYEYYAHGSYVINATCAKDSSLSRSESITIVNIPPLIIHDKIIINSSLEINITNNMTIEYYASNYTFITIVSDDDLSAVNHSLICANGTILWLVSDNITGFDDEHMIYSSNFTDFICNPFNFTTYAVDSTGNSSTLSTMFYLNDSIMPYAEGIDNVSWLTNTNYVFTARFFDENFFSYNYTCNDGSTGGETGLNVEEYSKQITINITTNITCEWVYCDGHTKNKLEKNWDILKTDKKLKFRIDNKKENVLEIETEETQIDYERLEDRIKFTVINTDKSGIYKNYLMTYTASDKSVYLRDERYNAWIVDPNTNTWFDLNGIEEEIKIYRRENGVWEFRWNSNKENFTFESIGELNCNSKTQVITATLPPDIPTTLFGWFTFDTECKINTISETVFWFALFLIILAVIILNRLFYMLPVLEFLSGIALFVFGFSLLSCTLAITFLCVFTGIFLMYTSVLMGKKNN